MSNTSIQKLKTEKGVYTIQIDKKSATLTLVEDLTGSFGLLSESFSTPIFETTTYKEILLFADQLHNEAINFKNNPKRTDSVKIEENIKYNSLNILDEDISVEFIEKIEKEGRAFYKLDNGSIITICRPMLYFENKNEEFKKAVFESEKNFWNKRITDDKFNSDIKNVAKLMISLF